MHPNLTDAPDHDPVRHDRVQYFRGHDLAGLADALACALIAAPLAAPLAGEVIVVPHPGMGRWLEQRYAQRFGIAACLDLVLPAKLVWRTLTLLEPGLPAQSGYERAALRWRLHALIEERAGTRGFEVLGRYVHEGDDRLRAWELAERLADAYDQYLVYRPDWLARWERGELVGLPSAHEAWQARLWREVRSAIGEPHRAELVAKHAERLAGDARGLESAAPHGWPERITVFGVSTLPPPHLRFLAALATRVPTRWYQLEPSDEWWGDLVLGRERRRLAAEFARDGVPEAERHLAVEHPLLEAWGRIGRDFVRLLYETLALDDETVPAEEPDTQLGWLRCTFAALDPAVAPPPAPDTSLAVVGCADPLREVEVLHDALLARFEADPTLTPRDVVVMTPRYADYAPLIEAVFGAAPEPQRLPYTLADRTAATHPLVHAFGRLLRLPQSRLAASEVLDLLAVPAVARRAGFDGDAVARLAAWVEATRIRWGLDAADRARAGVGAYEDFSWHAGLDRLLLGYAHGSDDALVAGVLPYVELEGQGAMPAGAALRFVDRLSDWRARLAHPRRASAWPRVLAELVDEFFEAALADADESAAVQSLRAAIGELAASLAAGGSAPAGADEAGAPDRMLAADVVRAALESALAEPERRQRFLATGITVCAMVPMRNVPFRVVCLLGLDDGAFPRREADSSLQLMRAAPRAGDRSRSDDDRYLFLEAILAAREALHLSYVAVNAKDGAARPPSPVVQELVDFVVSCHPAGVRDAVRRSLVASAPDAPYDPSRYAGGAGSYDRAWEPSARALAGAAVPQGPFAVAVAAATAQAPRIALDDVLAYFRNPASDYARRVLRLERGEIDAPEDDEPFELDGLERHRLDELLLRRVLREPSTPDAALLAAARGAGLARPGLAGAIDVRARAASVRELVRRVGTLPVAVPTAIDRVIGPHRLVGNVRTYDGEPMVLRPGAVRGVDWLQLALLGTALGVDGACAYGLGKDGVDGGRLDLARIPPGWLEAMLGRYLAARTAFQPLLRRSSWAYADEPDEADAIAAARRVLAGSSHHGAAAEADEPYVALALRGRAVVVDAEFGAAARAVYGPVIDAIDVDLFDALEASVREARGRRGGAREAGA